MLDHGQMPFSVKYEVVETNADLVELKVVHQGFDRDIAETSMMLKFRASGYGKDFMLIDRNAQAIIGVHFTTKTSQLRGECQG
jgi:hypothetical protein